MKLIDYLKKEYQSFGNQVILTSNRELICCSFDGETNDLIAKFNFPYKIQIKTNQLIDLGKEIVVKEQNQSILNEFTRLTTDTLVDIFKFNRTYLEAIQDTIRLIDATHVRFFSMNERIYIRVFNLPKLICESSFTDGAYYETWFAGDSSLNDFTFTLNSSSFLKLKKTDYEVNILENGIIDFVALDFDGQFFFRNQDIFEPITEFKHETLNTNISIIL